MQAFCLTREIRRGLLLNRLDSHSFKLLRQACHRYKHDTMHLMYTEDPATGNRIYTLKKVLDGVVTKSAHPARFSPDDKYSRSVLVFVHAPFLSLNSSQTSGHAEKALRPTPHSTKYVRQRCSLVTKTN